MAGNAVLNPGLSQKQNSGEGFSSQFSGMSKNQLYDIMSQMKNLIEQNQQQARQILVANPLLTKGLFQAQIMLGMVQPPQVMPNIQQASSQQPQQSAQPAQRLNVQVSPSLSTQPGPLGQASSSLPQIPARKHTSALPAILAPPATLPPQSVPLHPMKTAQQLTAQHAHSHVNPPPSQTHSPPILPLHSAPLPSILQPPSQQSLQTSGILQQPLQPPLPLQPRPPMQPFSHQLHTQMGPNPGFQPLGSSQQLQSQAMFHPGANPPNSIGFSFLQGQPPLPSQPPSQQLYQVGSHMGADLNSQGGSSMQVERGGPWMPGPSEAAIGGVQMPGPPPLIPGQSGPRPPQLPPEVEKALLQQVMSLTPEQINLLPPEQRHQVIQLQQMLR